MPWGEFDPEDPNELVGFECEAGVGTMEEMARSLVQEYVMMGMSPDQIFKLFEDPFFGLTHRIFLEKGSPYVAGLIHQVTEGWYQCNSQKEKNGGSNA